MISRDHVVEEKTSEAIDNISIAYKRATKVLHSGSQYTSIIEGRVSFPSVIFCLVLINYLRIAN